jgi:hypothetical protein
MKQERDILANRRPLGRAWFARETGDIPPNSSDSPDDVTSPQAYQAEFPIRVMCRVLEVSTSGYSPTPESCVIGVLPDLQFRQVR